MSSVCEQEWVLCRACVSKNGHIVECVGARVVAVSSVCEQERALCGVCVSKR